MDKWIKKTLLIILVAYVVVFVFSKPETAADLVKSTVGGFFDSLFTFFATLVAA